MRTKCIRSFAFACLIVALTLPLPVAAKSLHQLRQQWRETSRKISQVQWHIHELKRSQKTAGERLHASERRLSYSRTNLRDVQNQLGATRNRLSRTKAELVVIEKRLRKRNDVMASRLVTDYRRGNSGYLNVLIGSADFSDLMSRSYVVRKIVENDVDLMNEFKADRQDARDHKLLLEQEEQRRVDLERQQSALVREIADETQVRALTLKEVCQERAKYEQMLEELERSSSQMAAMIRRMERTPQGRRRLAQAWHGSFMRPVGGRITSGFGMRFHPVIGRYKLHTGVDIACPIGTPIHAAAGGVVILAGWGGAYGNCVIIDHGGGVTTLYGHQSRLAVRSGSAVRQGQIIGYSGSTGWSTGPHCHFEVRKHGSPVNPL